MKTTLEIPDELFREAKAKAALEGIKLKDLVVEGLRYVVQRPSAPVRQRELLKFPLFKSRSKERLNIPDDAAFRADLMDDLARHEASLR